MKAIVVGLGVQGAKRRAAAGKDFVATVDPVRTDADFRSVQDVPLDRYDSALVCTPDEPKVEVLEYLLSNGKHLLVEKPLWAARDDDILRLERIARENHAVCYTAYNHRFEPHYVRMRDTIRSGVLGEIYHCRMFYGNGTARLVRDSEWRDAGAGVLPDLGSHLLDTLRFWFDGWDGRLELVGAERFENRSPDHVVLSARGAQPAVDLEMTLLNWRNHFYCDILAEKGSAHIRSLCKWGPSEFILRKRVLPSGRPPEQVVTLIQDDPTWQLEYDWFKQACASGQQTDLSTDRYIGRALGALEVRIAAGAGR